MTIFILSLIANHYVHPLISADASQVTYKSINSVWGDTCKVYTVSGTFLALKKPAFFQD